MIKKQCNYCGIEKVSTDFSPSGRHKDGLKSHCKLCVNAKKQEQLAIRNEKIRVLKALAAFKSQDGERVPSRDHSNYKMPYVPQKDESRNDGNKHIKSRGVGC